MVSSLDPCYTDLLINGTETKLPVRDFPVSNMPDIPEWFDVYCNIPWLNATIGSVLVGITGILPLLIIDINQESLQHGAAANKLKTLLSFAVGALLGDVFLHSMPEIYSFHATEHGQQTSGLLILSGLIIFIAVEKLLTSVENVDENHVSGYLNLVANTIDNCTHGLSLGGAFLVSPSLGALTTLAILVHEIPHEVGDFAILLRAGFTRRKATIWQLATAGGGLIGAFVAIYFSGASNSIEARTSWILPFTAGSFLHIGLVTVLPDLLKEEDPKESFKQMVSLLTGILLIAVVGNMFV